MFDVESDDYANLELEFGNIRKWDKIRLASEIVNSTFKFFHIEREIKKKEVVIHGI